MATRQLQPPHFPATYGQRGAAPLTGLPLATHWPQRGGAGATSPGPPPTGHLRPTWPSEAFGHLPPTPADRGLRAGGLPHPQTFGERRPKGRGGVFAGKGRMATGARAHRHTLGDPLRPTPLTD